jgi:hypothetical protein
VFGFRPFSPSFDGRKERQNQTNKSASSEDKAYLKECLEQFKNIMIESKRVFTDNDILFKRQNQCFTA